jgi:hypothetical protein
MNISNINNLLPPEWPHSHLEAINKKIVAENVIEETLIQISNENRNLTKWECDCISNAMGAILFGSYVLAVNNVKSCFLSKNEVSRTAEWWSESEDLSLEDLQVRLEKIKGYPPRVDY